MTVNPEPPAPQDAAPAASPTGAAAAGRCLRRAGTASLLYAGPLAAVAALVAAPLVLASPLAGPAHARQPGGSDRDQCNVVVAAAEAMAMKWPRCTAPTALADEATVSEQAGVGAPAVWRAARTALTTSGLLSTIAPAAALHPKLPPYKGD